MPHGSWGRGPGAAVKKADGTRLIKAAEAEEQALRRAAVASPGGANLVALEMARNLNLGDMMVSTQLINPLDVNQIIKSLGAK